ncbi:MAG: RecX family transcriptional regulator [Tannerella sp.]|jgi:regulatory protein|nr:RecX family transcriptional regulator [Tannerella sp.]
MKTESEVLNEMARYCSQSERCLHDVHNKIKAADLPADAVKRITDSLLKDKFIDEKRFSRSFVNDKFKFNQWGRIKICYELKQRNIPPDIYGEAVENIDEDEYLSALADLLNRKKRAVKGASPQDVFQKLYRFAASRGFESQLIVKTLKSILKNIEYEQYPE